MSESATDDDRHKAARYKTILSSNILLLLVLALSTILASVIIEYNSFFNNSGKTYEEKLHHLSTPFYWSAHFYSALLREVGFAFAIAVLITLLVERTAKWEQAHSFAEALKAIEARTEIQLEEIKKDVFHAVLKQRVPHAVSDIALDILIAQNVIREQLHLKYVLKSLDDNELSENGRFIAVEGTLTYILRNITQEEVIKNINLFLPFPARPDLKGLLEISRVEIGQNALTTAEIQKGIDETPNTDTEMRASWTVNLPSDGSVRVSLQYKLIKERSDSDCWTSLYATTDGQYDVNVEIGDLEWCVDALHSGKLMPADGSSPGLRMGGSCIYNFEKALLPYQGVLLWWRPRSW